jgi:chromosomal replication initiator protein
MPNTVKLIKNRVPLTALLPPMIIEIIQEHITAYAKEHMITKFNVEFGYIEESVMIDVHEDVIEQSSRAFIMTYQAKIIELFLFDHYKTDSEVYLKVRNREILRVRQVIQFFMTYYSSMPLESIGFITGKKDHATVMHSKKTILNRLKKGNGSFKKEIFMLDRLIFKKLGIEKSSIFDLNANLIDLPIK